MKDLKSLTERGTVMDRDIVEGLFGLGWGVVMLVALILLAGAAAGGFAPEAGVAGAVFFVGGWFWLHFNRLHARLQEMHELLAKRPGEKQKGA